MRSAQRLNILGAVAVTALLLWVGGTALAASVDLTLQDSYTNPGDPSGYGPQPSEHPEQDPTKGWIEGTLTASSGSPLASASVAVQGWRGTGGYFSTTTAANGRYRVSNLVPGQYIVNFQVVPSLFQWAHQKISPAEDATFVVTANQATVVDDTALPHGTITGRFTDPEGHGEQVRVSAMSSGEGWGNAGAGPDGSFSMPVFVGTYVVEFTRASGARQYAYQQADYSKAARFTVAAGATVVVNDTALSTGAIAGHLTENDGTPAAGAYAYASGGGGFFSTTVAADGGYQFPQVPAGEYQVDFRSADYARRQYAYHTVETDKAAKIAVTAGQTTTVVDTFLPTGSFQVTATDEAGHPMTDFCAYIWGGGAEKSACSNGSTTITLTGLPEGSNYEAAVYTSGDTYLTSNLSPLTITGGQVTTRAVVLRKAAIIEATVLDKATHQPVDNACIGVLTLQFGTLGDGFPGCTDQAGHVRITGLEAGKYTLFVSPQDDVHGAQWLGSTGGTGSQYLAKQINAPAGSVTVAPTIYLDPAGSIAGTVTDADSGKPIAGVCVATTAIPAAWFHIGSGCGGSTDAAGHYRVGKLGPYSWPVEYAAMGYAWQWSGGTGSRLLAAPVKVTAGQTATSNAAISRGSAIKGRVIQGGTAVPASVSVYDLVTGDAVGDYADAPDGSYEVHVKPGLVRIEYEHDVYPYTDHWYRDAADFRHATPVLVGLRPVTLDLVLPAG